MQGMSVIRSSLVLVACIAACSTSAPRTHGDRQLPTVLNGAGGEAWIAHHPNGGMILFGRHDTNWDNHRLFVTRYVDGIWTEPQAVPFTAGVDGKAPHFAPDGRSVLFASTRPRPGAATQAPADLNIWRVNWDGQSWGEPQLLPAPLNSTADEIDAVEVSSGAIYFSSTRDEGSGRRADLYRATPADGGYRVATLTTLSTERVESTLFVTADETLVVFSRTDDPAGLGSDDLFYSRKQGATWTAPTHLPGEANSKTYDYGPEISLDRATLYFTSHRDGEAGILAIDLVEAMRPLP